jgi:FixJ family two-component response regulator
MNPTNPPTVFIVDDDPDMVASLGWLLDSDGLRVETFASAQELLDELHPDAPGCVLVDLRMPGVGGLELQDELTRRSCRHPVVFVTGHGDVPSCSRAYRNGAFDFLEKPVDEPLLLDVVHRALSVDSDRRAQQSIRPDLATLVTLLTPREQQVMDLLVEGKSVKQIAVELGVGFPTAARHRSRVLEKMQVHNDVELVRLVLALVP